MHQQTAQKGAELLQRLFVIVAYQVAVVVDVGSAAGRVRHHVVVNRIKTGCDADDYRNHRQRIEEGGQKCRRKTEG
ncbi:hypothetical protein D3C78_1326710 [compost metagenome]